MSSPAPWMATTPCRWHRQGKCLRGVECWFMHDGDARKSEDTAPVASTSTLSSEVEDGDELCCSICFERPQMYGLLECQHVFCLNCIKLWRSAKDKTDEQKDLSAFAGCPTCRHKTAVVIPSTIYFGNGTEKDNITRSYKESRARIECRHFQDNLPRLFCPFGTDCLYKHTDPDTGLAHVFEHSHMDTLEQSRRRRHRRAAEDEYLSERELRRILSRFFRGHSRSAGANGLDPIDHLEELAMLDALEEARLDYEYDYDEDEDEEVMMSDGDSWATEEEEGAEGVDEDEEGSEWEHESDFSVE